jgi:hypothetical protein
MRRLRYYAEVSVLMGYIQGEGRDQGTLFPVYSTTLCQPIMCAARLTHLSKSRLQVRQPLAGQRIPCQVPPTGLPTG